MANDEGLRKRKRRQTRERIATAALSVFLERGFEATTIELIVERADVSKRSFFDYFPAKEDVIFAWQEQFGEALAAAVRARPKDEPLAVVVEQALTSSVIAAVQTYPEGVALEKLIRETPVLRSRDHLKYARLEEALCDALMERMQDDRGRFRARLLAVIVIGGLRIANDARFEQQRTDSIPVYTLESFNTVWAELAEFARSARNDATRNEARKIL